MGLQQQPKKLSEHHWASAGQPLVPAAACVAQQRLQHARQLLAAHVALQPHQPRVQRPAGGRRQVQDCVGHMLVCALQQEGGCCLLLALAVLGRAWDAADGGSAGVDGRGRQVGAAEKG